MIFALAAYAIVAAAVFGFLMADYTRPRSYGEGMPLFVLILLPPLWLPVLIGVVLLIVTAVVANVWTEIRTP